MDRMIALPTNELEHEASSPEQIERALQLELEQEL